MKELHNFHSEKCLSSYPYPFWLSLILAFILSRNAKQLVISISSILSTSTQTANEVKLNNYYLCLLMLNYQLLSFSTSGKEVMWLNSVMIAVYSYLTIHNNLLAFFIPCWTIKIPLSLFFPLRDLISQTSESLMWMVFRLKIISIICPSFHLQSY